eukprot:TRINITY_DN614_c0_g1_i4.p1 TRINITY_DN614_c0_g1~~TRINITY_DN614_c0_g1_i4.p1  ORF type:complete len:112 (-),score=21.60 TRINITY_DN614_c0_g1_i4:380-715(-)
MCIRDRYKYSQTLGFYLQITNKGGIKRGEGGSKKRKKKKVKRKNYYQNQKKNLIPHFISIFLLSTEQLNNLRNDYINLLFFRPIRLGEHQKKKKKKKEKKGEKKYQRIHIH